MIQSRPIIKPIEQKTKTMKKETETLEELKDFAEAAAMLAFTWYLQHAPAGYEDAETAAAERRSMPLGVNNQPTTERK